MRSPKGITLRITLFGWVVTLLTLGVFVVVIVPSQQHEFQLNLESKARGIAVSIKGVAAGAAVSEDYSVVVEQTMQVLAGDPAIDYVIITKNDGFAVITDRSSWKIERLDSSWRPATRTPASSIGVVPLFGRRAFQYAFPFDYSGIEWGWIHVGLSLDSYENSVRNTFRTTGALVVLCGLLSLFISLLYAKRLVKPIHALHHAVEKVAQGDLEARAHVTSGDEIERLAVSFNDMAATILGRNQNLESVSFAAKQWLSATDPGTVAGTVMEKIVLSTGASRAYLLKIATADDQTQPVMQQMWPPCTPRACPDECVCAPQQPAGLGRWFAPLQDGQIVTANSADLKSAACAGLDPGSRSTILIPIIVSGVCWGVIGLDDIARDREWGEAEKGSLRAIADMLGTSIARQKAQSALLEAKETLEQRVAERTRELQEQIEAKDRANAELAAAQQRLIEFSRQSGMAEIATGVLHNVGNVLNSVNVSTSVVAGKIRESRIDNLVALIRMLEQNSGNLQQFLETDPKGQRVLPYLTKLGGHFQSEREGLLQELELLSSHVGHIKQIVATQQSYAKVSGLVENICLAELVDDAFRIVEPSMQRHAIRIERDYAVNPVIAAEKHQILQILLNLLRNAKQAVQERDGGENLIRVSIRLRGEDRICVAVQDTGVGLPPENLTRIFAHGFTTKANGHGFGLHSCALAARQMGGTLRAESEGIGRGATFTLDLPLQPANQSKERS